MSLHTLRQRLLGNQPPSIGIQRRRMGRVTVEEIRQLCQANPTHPTAIVLSAAVEGMPGTLKLFCETIDLLGVMDNKRVEQVVGADGINAKQLGETL